MKLVVQRVKAASVKVDGKTVGDIGSGLLVLVGVSHGDTAADAAFLAKKTVNLRVFDDADGVMNDNASCPPASPKCPPLSLHRGAPRVPCVSCSSRTTVSRRR